MYRKAPTPAIKWKLFKRTHGLIGGRMDQDGRFADGIRRILDGLSDCFAIGQIAFEQPRVLIFLGQVLDIEHGYSGALGGKGRRSEEHTSELQSLMRISYAVFCLKKKKKQYKNRYII